MYAVVIKIGMSYQTRTTQTLLMRTQIATLLPTGLIPVSMPKGMLIVMGL